MPPATRKQTEPEPEVIEEEIDVEVDQRVVYLRVPIDFLESLDATGQISRQGIQFYPEFTEGLKMSVVGAQGSVAVFQATLELLLPEDLELGDDE